MSRSHVRRLRVVAIALSVACSDPTATEPGDPLTGTAVATITVTPSSAIMGVGQTRALSGVAKDASGQPVTATLTWKTSSASVATVDATGKLTALAEGTTNITASSGSVQSTSVGVTVTDNALWPTSGASASSLIESAVQQGKLTQEQGLVYRVFASFGDSRLPKEYRGIPDDTPDDPVLMEAADQFTTLSAAAQAQLAPFFVPPAYAGSWYEARIQSTASASAAVPSVSHGTAVASVSVGAARASDGDCVFLPFHRTLETTHFKIHYFIVGGNNEWDLLESKSATIVADEAEKIWAKETAVFGRTPLSDAGVTNQCKNGGDGKLDIYVENPFVFSYSSGNGTSAKVVPFQLGTCAKTASTIIVAGDGDLKRLRNALAHEFFHVLELGSYERAANCFKEYYWLGEATGNWAMDLVYPQDQFEHPWAGRYMDSERLVPLDQAFAGDADKTNGYTDYVFLQYLARKYNNSVIKDIWDASESAKSVTAIVDALASRGGIKTVWPEFALALWNDFGANNQNDFNKWDQLEWGMKRAFDRKDAGDRFGNPSIKVDQKGAPRESFELLTSSPANGSAHELPRLTVHADYLKFTDASVASVLYTNGFALADLPNLKIQAMVKKGGAWKAAEDWTKEGVKSFCLDLKDERVEELVLIYSNSDGDIAGQPIPFLHPQLNVSNVGCARWEGSSSIDIVVTGVGGGTSNVSATNIVFERLRDPQFPDGVAGRETFTTLSANVMAAATGLCSSLSGNGSAIKGDGSLMINLDNMGIGTFLPPPDRDVIQGDATSSIITTFAICGVTKTEPMGWSWLNIPLPGPTVSADGRTISGNVTQPLPGSGSATLKWNLTAVREP